MKTSLQHSFAQIPDVKTQRSSFNRSHCHKTTFDENYLYPVLVDEIIPGDTFNVKATMFARMATPIKPLMDNLYLDTFWFFVPNRLVWDHWVNLMGEKSTPDDDTEYLVPTMTAPAVTGHVVGSLSDYMGIPTGIPALEHISLAHRAYNLIHNYWFRSQQLMDPVVVDTGDGPDTASNYVLLKRTKRFDYFTSCLPFPQQGPSVMLPLGESAPVLANNDDGGTVQDSAALVWRYNGGGNSAVIKATSGTTLADSLGNGNANNILKPKVFVTGTADLSDATASTINELRQAFQIQRMQERDMRGGTRYKELLRSHFGVESPDFRLQYPEYLGGSTQHISINPVAQTSGTPTTGTPQGNLSGIGTVISRNGFTKSFVEHGILMCLVNVRADLTYQQGLNRMFSRQTRVDYYWPSLANLGEQAVLNKEIYAQGPAVLDGSDIVDDQVFGYQERYAEYRYNPSKITGKFRSTYSTPLDNWHVAQEFGSLPELGQTFIEENVPMARVLAVPSEPHFIFDSYFEMNCVRPMPVYSVPGMIDHF